MRCFVRLIVSGFALAAAVACSVPTDKSNDIQVRIDAPQTFLLRGEEMSVQARAYRVLATGDTVDVPNVDFIWSTGATSTASVHKECCGYATVQGVNRGDVDITVQAPAFEKASDGVLRLRVADALEIDSVRPRLLKYGQRAVIYGLGVDKVFSVSLGPDPWFPDAFSVTGDSGGVGTMESWVLPRADTGLEIGHVRIAGAGFIKSDTATTTVIPEDIFEPDSLAPAQIDINAPFEPRKNRDSFPFLFFNPGLYYEPVPPGNFSAVDWFRFDRTDTAGPVTFIVNSSVQFDTAFSYLSDSLFYQNGSYFIGDSAWIISPGFYTCNNQGFFPLEKRPQSTIIALKSLPGPRRGMQLLSFYQVEGQYTLAVINGYVTTSNKIGPDRFEENDLWCNFADANFNDPNRRIVLDNVTPLFQDSTLTIDNPHDIDWYKFRVAGAALDSVTIATKPLPLGLLDLSNIDLYVIRASDWAFMGAADTSISYETLTLQLPPDDYYLGVVDFTGVPTRYSLCMRKSASGLGCTPPGVGPAPLAQRAPGTPRPRRNPTIPPTGFPALLRLPSPRP